ncbi:MAG: hypothetical protein KBC96_10875 [Armatimonadetes bacterium]|nr:hypothetical protein [Armatimonadota bacterium]
MPRLRLFIVVLMIALSASALAADRITCMTTWDAFYLYAAVQVQDPDVRSENTKHMSNPWEDDAVEIFLETDDKRAADRSPNTFQMSISAGGGSSWIVGQDGTPTPKPIYSFKFARKVQGTLNKPNDKDIGYTIELAIPWKEVGAPPEPGDVMGFNLVCRMKGDRLGFVSFSPEVKTEEDIQVPAKWSRIKFTNSPTIIAIQDGAVVSRKVVSRAPVIDGVLSAREWNTDLSFQMTKPAPVPLPPEKQKYAMEKLSLTHYFYWYQGDARKDAPFGHVVYSDGSSELTNQPIKGAGPWFSFDQVQWHKDELADVREANIDVVIPVYWGSADNKRAFATKGLDCMVQALKELKAEGRDYPLVGMFFDTTSMNSQYGGKPDLRGDEVKQTFYGMIKDFFLHVPDEFRAAFQLPPEKGGGSANIVVLYTASWFSDLDPSFVEYCNSRYAEDFGGKLVWVGSSDYRPKAEVMDGYSDYAAGLGLKYDDTGWIDIAGVGAGYDDSAVRGRNSQIRSRMFGDTYRRDWDSLSAESPNWVIVDGWNELHEGSDICASRQYGIRYISLTKINMLRFNGMRPYDAKFIKHDVPAVMYPGAIHQVKLTMRNAGTRPWNPGDGVFIASRWYKDGRLFADSGIRVPLQELVPAGRSIEKTVGIMVVDQDRKALEEGDYELRVELVRGADQWFTDAGDSPLTVPVKVSLTGRPGFTLVGSDAPTLMKSGASYSVALSIRNDGPTAWPSGARVAYRWQRASVHLGADSDDRIEVIASNELAASIPAEVLPGRIVEVTVPVAVVGSDGAPLPARTQQDLWGYRLKWDVHDGAEWLASSAVGQTSEAVAVTPDDLGPRFVESDTPEEMNAGRKYTVLLTVRNTGPDAWDKAACAVGYHWYYLDGTEAVWDGSRSQLPGAVRSGEQAIVKAQVTAPPYDGQYYLVWDLLSGDKYASTAANTRGGNTLILPVNVTKGRLAAQDLTKAFDADVISWDTDRRNGDLDAGLTFPAEFMPPQVLMKTFDGALWSSGLWSARHGSGLESSRRISFRYPPKLDGANNAVTCTGQTLALKSGKYSTVHILAAAAQDVSADFGLSYGSKTASVPVKFSSWEAPPKFGERVGFACLHRHSPEGDQRGQACYLNHYEIRADASSDLTAIRLPNTPGLKILAITLEKPQ